MAKDRTNKKVCIHGHFYQPTRKNPWSGRIPLFKETYPYHDWNEKIHAECYRANAFARVLDQKGKIEDIVNNYSRISFNFGPTLLEWIWENDPDTYAAILDADRASAQRFSGHGSAMAQVYNHIIMPLSTQRDKRLQTEWAIADFQKRFGRKPEGMWLAETAVDLASLEVLADHGIRFTVLSPYQALRVRKAGDGGGMQYQDVLDGAIDTRKAYRCRLPSGKSLALFFYDKGLSTEVSFGDILKDGQGFAGRIKQSFSDDPQAPEIVVIASDGEVYGHHKEFADMALAYCLRELEASGDVRLTVFGEYLKEHPPQDEVEIIENTAWSCAHNLSRWSSGCSCGMPQGPEEPQPVHWRKPLRDAIALLREEIDAVYDAHAPDCLQDPRKAEEALFAYVEVLDGHSPEKTDAFLNKIVRKDGPGPSSCKSLLLRLLEMQHQALLMQSSDAWFFDDITRIEARQVLQNAQMALELAEGMVRKDLVERFLSELKKAKSIQAPGADGRSFFEEKVEGSAMSAWDIVAHFAARMIFSAKDSQETLEVGRALVFYRHQLTIEKDSRFQGQDSEAAAFRVRTQSLLTGQTECFEALSFWGKDLGVQGDLLVMAMSHEGHGQTGTQSLMDRALPAYQSRGKDALVHILKETKGVRRFTLEDLDQETQVQVIEKMVMHLVKKPFGDEGQAERLGSLWDSLSSLDVSYAFREYFEWAANIAAKKAVFDLFEKKDPRVSDIQPLKSLSGLLLGKKSGTGKVPVGPGITRRLEESFRILLRRHKTEGRDSQAAKKALQDLAASNQVVRQAGIDIQPWYFQNLLMELKKEYGSGPYGKDLSGLFDCFGIATPQEKQER